MPVPEALFSRAFEGRINVPKTIQAMPNKVPTIVVRAIMLPMIVMTTKEKT